MGLLIGIYLAKLGFDPAAIGTIIGAGLGRAAVAALVVTLVGDGIGGRKALVALSLLGAAGGLIVATVSGINVIAAAPFVRMLNGMGRDRRAPLIIYQVMLSATTSDVFSKRSTAGSRIIAPLPVLLCNRQRVPGLIICCMLPVLFLGWSKTEKNQPFSGLT